jgi:hypothetical protein
MVSVPLTDIINVLPTDTTNAFCSSEKHKMEPFKIAVEEILLKIQRFKLLNA